MAEIYSFGLQSLKMGNPDVDGGMGTTLTDIGKIVQDTCDLVSADPTTDEEFSEQDDTPVMSFITKGIDTLKFSLFDCTAATLMKVLGGTVDGTSGAWNAPSDSPSIVQSIEITTKSGLVISIPSAKVLGKLNYQFRKRGLLKVDVTANIQVPGDGSAPISIDTTP